jgi:hypothetical protein
MGNQKKPMQDALPWLLEKDSENPGVRYFALTELLGHPSGETEASQAQAALMQTGPVPAILAAQDPAGFWVEPGAGYYPKYRGTLWQVIFLAQLGADGRDPQIQKACEYVLAHTPTPNGGLSATGLPSGLIHCLQGNLLRGLLDLGWGADERVAAGLEWLACSITGSGIAPASERRAPIRYLRSGNSAPGFACSANNHLPCAWGGVKAMLALSRVPMADRSPAIQEAIERGVEFLLGRDPAAADYPMGYSAKPNRSWFKFGFPIAYVTDVLQNLEVLAALGYAGDPRLENALTLLLSKQDAKGRWPMEYTYNGKTWVDIEAKGQPSKWVTLRALRVLNRVAGSHPA